MEEYKKKLEPSLTQQGWRTIEALRQYIDDGRDLEVQQSEREGRIAQWGTRATPPEWRRNIIEGLGLRPQEWGAPVGEPDENLIVLGCSFLSRIKEIIAFRDLVQRLGGRYTFLPMEHCCGSLLNLVPLLRGDIATREQGVAMAKEFIGRNIAEARHLGVKRMYYTCSWCVYHAHRFYHDCDIELRYYMDLVVDLLEKTQPKLKLDAKIGYYQGCQQRRFVYIGASDWNFDWTAYRACLDRIEGLRTTDIQKFCCMTDADRIFKALEEKQLSTMVTPCMACAGQLRRTNREISIMNLSGFLLEALR